MSRLGGASSKQTIMQAKGLTADPPCQCGYSGMELESIELTSKLTGIQYDCVRCTICKTVFHAEAPDACDECGAQEDENHLGWCSQSDVDWPKQIKDYRR